MSKEFLSFLFCFLFIPTIYSQAVPLPNGHAHNDYEKPRPALVQALKHGFISVEIDVFPVKENLKVAHISLLLPTARDLEKMYFMPLQEWIDKHKTLFKDKNQRLVLMIDIKRDANKSYQLLRQLCQKYDHLLTKYYPQQDSVSYGQVDIILSGHKPHELVKNDSLRYMLLDGGLNEIGQSPKLYPRVSTRYGSVLKWRGAGEIPAAQKEKIKALVEKAQQSGQKLRFWAMPNHPKVWKTLLDLGVDWMNVDHLKKFKKFYANYAK